MDISYLPEYSIPEEIDSQIPDIFYPAMLGELVSVFGLEIITPVQTDTKGQSVYNLPSSTSGWYAALKMTCKKLNLKFLYDYWELLDWYQSDLFDGIIEYRIIEKVIKNKEKSSYYNWVLDNITLED